MGFKEDPAKALDGLLSMMEFQVVEAAKAMPAGEATASHQRRASSLQEPKPRSSTPCAPSRHWVTHLAWANYFLFRLERR